MATTTGKTVLTQIMDDLAKIDLRDRESPDFKVNKGEEVVGIMDDHVKRLYCHLCDVREHLAQSANKIAHFAVDLTLEKKEKVDTRILEDELLVAARIRKKIEILEPLLWLSIYEACPAAQNGHACGIREGWKIVTMPAREPELAIGIPASLAALLFGHH